MATTSSILSWRTEGRAEGRAEGMAEGMALGMTEARREDLLKLLRVKFVHLPPELPAAIRETSNLELLGRWFDAAIAAPTLEAFAVLVRGR